MERNETLGLVISEHCFLCKKPGSDPKRSKSGIEDEIFSGWAVRIFPETLENGWVQAETHYGYRGYVPLHCLRLVSREELWKRQDQARLLRIAAGNADLLDEPRVQGLPQECLLKNSFVELISKDTAEGWSRIRTAAGREGYVHTAHLCARKDDDKYLLGERELAHASVEREDAFREGVVQSARAYLGVQYRWGGKSSHGLDCSGLAFMSYLENGVLIYRDAKMMEQYPIRAIHADQLKKGDLIFFPGHVAIYLGDGRYIHSTAYAATPCVTINSLRPEDPDFRADLAEKITAYGSLFDGQ